MRARHIVHPWDPGWFLVHGFWSHSLGERAAAQLQRRQPLPTLCTSHLHGEPKFLTQPKTGNFSLEEDTEGRHGAVRGLREPPHAAAPQGLPPPWSLLRAVCFCCFLNSSKTIGNGMPERQVWGRFVLFCFPGGILRQGKKSIRASGRESRSSPSMDINGFSYL